MFSYFTCNLFQSDFSETKQDTLKSILLEIQISSVSVKIKHGLNMGWKLFLFFLCLKKIF